jgi:circadian clock protein KaiB
VGKLKIKHVEQGHYKFLLFVTGMSGKSVHAIKNIRAICDKHLAGMHDLEIIDITVNRQSAVKFDIIGVPTLIKVGPAPPRMILGDLSDTNKVLKILNITS